jgi:NTP pyrophosphatase (non-canonical NTP hydrolase)
MKLSELQQRVGEWSRRNFDPQDPDDPLLGLTEELGELAHAHLKLKQGIRGTPVEHVLKKQDAVGDIMIYLADYCERNGLDMEVCVEHAWREVKKRDWKNRPTTG